MSRIGWERIEELELREDEDVDLRNRILFLRILILTALVLLDLSRVVDPADAGAGVGDAGDGEPVRDAANERAARRDFRPLRRAAGDQPAEF